MGIKAIVESADELGDLKDFYKEDGGKFILDVDGIDDHPKVRGVITANRENVKKRDQYKAKVDELEARVSGLPEDFDADDWARLKAGDDGKKPDEQVQALKDSHTQAIERLKTKHAKEIAEKDTAINEREGYIDNSLLDGGLKDALLDAGVDPDLLRGAMGVVRGRTKVLRDDKGGRKPIAENDLGEEVAIPDFVKDWAASKEGRAYLGKASGPDPKGSQNTRLGAKTMSRDEFAKLDPAAQMKAQTVDKIAVVD